MRIAEAACNILVDNYPFAWRADWSWGVPLIVLTVLIHVSGRIAHRLLDRGYQLTVHDRDRAKARAIVAKGGILAKNILELARTADVLVSCLTDDEAVQSVYAGA